MTAPEVSTQASTLRADYGLDAPGVQRTAFFGGVAAVVVGRLLIEYGVMHSVNWAISVGTSLMSLGAGFFVAGVVMYFSSKVGKLLLRDAILNSTAWSGDEQVLDVGCGHGLMLLGAAKRLTSGHAVGIDVWSQKDQKDNSADATTENARREGVADRVEIRNADARQLPFEDNSFDVVLSTLAIHNISGSSERASAIREMARVLKPGGRLAIADIRFTRQYEKTLRSLGWQETQRTVPTLVFLTTRILRAVKPSAHA